MSTTRTRAAAVAFAALLTLAACGNEEGGETVGCEYPPDGSTAAEPVETPADEAPATGTAPVVLSTSAGELTMTLDRAAAPCTVASFLSLAEQGYFDQTPCHRLTTQGIFVLQCGDPTGTGAGGPGYRFADELTGSETYPAGTVAMANAGADTNGSQFFLVYEDSPLPPDYTVFGSLDETALTAVEKIAQEGTSTGAPDGPPAEPVTIESVSQG